MVQFDTWNDFDTSLPKPSLCLVNEFDPIVNDTNDVKLLISNVGTDTKQLEPITIELRLFSWDNEKVGTDTKQLEPIIIEYRLSRWDSVKDGADTKQLEPIIIEFRLSRWYNVNVAEFPNE